MKRSVIRGQLIRIAIPGLRFAPSGLRHWNSRLLKAGALLYPAAVQPEKKP
jgi:hypothetical protein